MRSFTDAGLLVGSEASTRKRVCVQDETGTCVGAIHFEFLLAFFDGSHLAKPYIYVKNGKVRYYI